MGIDPQAVSQPSIFILELKSFLSTRLFCSAIRSTARPPSPAPGRLEETL